MIFKDFYPSPLLEQFVKFYRLRHFVMPPAAKKLPFKPYPPRPEQCLAFYPRGEETTELVPDGSKVIRPRSVISGQFTNKINRYVCPHEFMIILVVFRPGALHRITGIPFHELLNCHADLESVLPQSRQVNQRLNSCDDYCEMISIIETFLSDIVKRKPIEERPSDEVLRLLTNTPGKYSLDWLASQACLSPRQFERKFDHYLGVNPKTFARIVRFNESYHMRLKYPKEDWLSIAVACGYHDYQHMVRDYKEFAHTTPNMLFAEEDKAPERLLGLNR